jgi:WD40 repeat protein
MPGAALAAKLAAGMLLAVCALATVAGGLLLRPPAEVLPAAGDKPARAEEARSRTDVHGDPLPKEALSRLGTTRFRLSGQLVGLTPDGKTLVLYGPGVYTLDLATGKHTCAFPADVTGEIYGAALSPDGKRLATVNGHGIHVWEFATGKLLHTFGSGNCNDVRFSPDGKRLAVLVVNRPGRLVELCEAETGKEVWSVACDQLLSGKLTFTPDGKTVAVAGWAAGRPPAPTGNTGGRGPRFRPPAEHGLVLLDAATGKERRRINAGAAGPFTVKVSPDGTLFAAICRDTADTGERLARVWEGAGGKEIARFRQSEKDLAGGRYISALAFAPDGKSLFTSGSGNGLIEWDLTTGNELRRIAPVCFNATELTFTADGKAVIVVGPGDITRLIDRVSGKDLTPEPEHSASVARAAFTPDGRTVLTSSGNTVTFWDPENGRERRRVALPPHRLLDLARDGRTAVLMEIDTAKPEVKRTLIFFDLTTGTTRTRSPLESAGKQYYEDSISAGEKLAALADVDRRSVHLFDVSTGKLAAALQEPPPKDLGIVARSNDLKVRHAALSDDGRTLVALCVDHTAQVWDLVKKTKLREFPLAEDQPGEKGWFFMPWQRQQMENHLYYAAVSPDCSRILYISQRGYQRLIDATTGLEVWRSALNGRGHSGLAFSPDGRTLARGDSDTVRLVEVATGKERHALTGHDNLIRSLAFSPDGSLLVSGSYDTTALVWDLTGRRTSPNAGKPLRGAELDACWLALAGDDAAKAYDAIRTLAASPSQALPYLEERLRPAEPADPKCVADLIAKLDGDRVADRDEASRELEKLGESAIPAIRKALAGRASAEVRRRLQAILAKQSVETRELSPDVLRTIRSLEILELIGTRQARDVVDDLSGGPRKARVKEEAKASLARLSRRQPGEP